MISLKKLNTSFSESNVTKLSKTIFNVNEKVDENIKNCPLDDLLESSVYIAAAQEKITFDSTKANIFTFPIIFRRLQDYFSFKNPVFTVFKPGEKVSVSMFSTENRQNYFFLFKVKKDDFSVKYTRDVLIFECILDKIEIPAMYRLITDDFYVSMNNKMFANALKVSSDNEKRSPLFPPQYVKGSGGGELSTIYKNNSNRIIVHVVSSI